MADPATTLLLATNGGGEAQVVGMLTLAVFTLPTGVRAWIEDVVVDDESRGAGVASALVAAALERAEDEGARTVDLTSRPRPRGGQPSLRPPGLRTSRDQRLPAHAPTATVTPDP